MAVPSDDDRPPQAVERPSDSGRLHGADAVRLHLTLAAGLALCTAAFIFEVLRAIGGNTLSWAYVFEWPIFAAFALYMWWNLLHGTDGSRRSSDRRRGRAGSADVTSAPGGQDAAASDDADLRAWQEYLRKLESDDAGRSGAGD